MSEQPQTVPGAGLPPEYLPHPTPLAWQMEPVPGWGIVVRFHDATGVRCVFLASQDARNFAADVERTATTAATGLIVPGSGIQ